MFDLLVIGYLFLGGAGGGACAVLSALEVARVVAPGRMEFPDDLFARAWPVCTVALVTGIVCIAADLPESERSPVILYETEKGWLLGRLSWYHSAYEPEAAADEIDLSIFP